MTRKNFERVLVVDLSRHLLLLLKAAENHIFKPPNPRFFSTSQSFDVVCKPVMNTPKPKVVEQPPTTPEGSEAAPMDVKPEDAPVPSTGDAEAATGDKTNQQEPAAAAAPAATEADKMEMDLD